MEVLLLCFLLWKFLYSESSVFFLYYDRLTSLFKLLTFSDIFYPIIVISLFFTLHQLVIGHWLLLSTVGFQYCEFYLTLLLDVDISKKYPGKLYAQKMMKLLLGHYDVLSPYFSNCRYFSNYSMFRVDFSLD